MAPRTDEPGTLYRGDRVFRRGAASLCEEGLEALAPDGEDLRWLRREGLWRAVQAHVAPTGLTEEQFNRSSCFLSFTTSRDVALRYANTRAPGEPHADGERARLVVVRLDVRDAEPGDEAGLLRLRFTCRARERRRTCDFCDGERRFHLLRLIDVPAYLERHPELQARPDALHCARRDREWLVLPLDWDRARGGMVSRIPLAPIWSLDWVGVDRDAAAGQARSAE